MSEYALEGPRWGSPVVTWSYASVGGSFSAAIGTAYHDTIEAAIGRWAQATGISFQQVADTTTTDIRIGWGTFGAGGEIGETDYSYQHGATETFVPGVSVRFQDPSVDPVGAAPGATYQGTTTTLYQVALHELGHALGLAHSTDPNAVLFPTLGPTNGDLTAADIAGVEAIYGTTGAAASVLPSVSPAATPATITLTDNSIAVYRFFDTHSGTQFLTADASERNTVIQTRPDLTYEGLGMGAISPAAGDPGAVPIYRFFDTGNGAHFFTASAAEASQIAATRHDLVQEQTTFYEHAAQQAGDVPVFRFFNSANGTHFFTDNVSERATLVASRPDMVNEGVAFYAPAT